MFHSDSFNLKSNQTTITLALQDKEQKQGAEWTKEEDKQLFLNAIFPW